MSKPRCAREINLLSCEPPTECNRQNWSVGDADTPTSECRNPLRWHGRSGAVSCSGRNVPGVAATATGWWQTAHGGVETASVDARVFKSFALATNHIRFALGSVRYQPAFWRSDGPVLAPHHGDRHLRGDGGRRLAL